MVARVAQQLERWLRDLKFLRREFESHCGTWGTLLRMRPYKPRSPVVVSEALERTSLLKATSAKHRSKSAALSPVLVTVPG
jgi:hypothetical protein